MSVPSEVKIPPSIKDISGSVKKRVQNKLWPSTGNITYNSSNRLISWNIPASDSLLDFDKLYWVTKCTLTKTNNTDDLTFNNSAESLIDRVQILFDNQIVIDTNTQYGLAESMLAPFTPLDFNATSGQTLGLFAEPNVNADLVATNPSAVFTSATSGGTVNQQVRLLSNNTYEQREAQFKSDKGTTIANGVSKYFVIPFRLSGLFSAYDRLVMLSLLSKVNAITINCYLANDNQCLRCVTNANPPVASAASYSLTDNYLLYDTVEVSDEYIYTLKNYISNGGVYQINSKEFNIQTFSIASGTTDISYQLSSVYRSLDAIFCSFFLTSELSNFGFNGQDRLRVPSNIDSIQLQVGGSSWYPAYGPLDVSASSGGVVALMETAKCFGSNGIEGLPVSFNARYYASERTMIGDSAAAGNNMNKETPSFFVVGFNFKKILEESNELAGLNTSENGNGIVTVRIKFSGVGSTAAHTCCVLTRYDQQINITANNMIERIV